MAGLDHLASIDLERLVREGELLVRHDSKHLVTDDGLAEVVEALGPDALVLRSAGAKPRSFARYRTRYFDTAGHDSYRDHVMGRRRRFKVRARRYLDTGDAFFEVKARLPRSQTEKTRWPLERRVADGLFGSDGPLPPEMAALVRTTVRSLYGREFVDELLPTVDMTFDRVTVFLPAARERVTVDSCLEVADARSGRAIAAERAVHIVEIKSPSRRGAVSTALTRAGIRSLPISKYCLALAALHEEDFRANRWRVASRALFPDPGASGRRVA